MKRFKQFVEDAPANVASSGAVDMNPTGKKKKCECDEGECDCGPVEGCTPMKRKKDADK